ncbi:hypothetical protein RE428_31830 [Marinobacter nanhaiticus D15-8W]|uniref:Uncharacterized protein n=1 Tax=Marinobacter nanhaiticus D15-8W TaxID=626887 RepID=N6WZF2_9GAMM|nr:hypothetical protein [Marinobacter nanhaiticus]ENO16941.1 hypothetical protein J057_01680 [Marinobacter nanhaiticus D15-8W]BES72165.1 hypothetical protein RE428_31830 [Marinobacter nanhaiticus D15-8W]
MAYSTSNPPRLCGQPIAGQRHWQYVSTDAVTDVRVDGYFTNAEELGMKVNDIVTVIDSDGNDADVCIVLAINADGSADLSDGTAISETNTD